MARGIAGAAAFSQCKLVPSEYQRTEAVDPLTARLIGSRSRSIRRVERQPDVLSD
jgi:hypothetical protein